MFRSERSPTRPPAARGRRSRVIPRPWVQSGTPCSFATRTTDCTSSTVVGLTTADAGDSAHASYWNGSPDPSSPPRRSAPCPAERREPLDRGRRRGDPHGPIGHARTRRVEQSPSSRATLFHRISRGTWSLQRRVPESASQRSGRDQRVVGAEEHLRAELRVRVLDEQGREVLRRPGRTGRSTRSSLWSAIEIASSCHGNDGYASTIFSVGEVGGDVVEAHRVGVLQAQAAAARKPGADAAVPGVEERGQPASAIASYSG